MKSKELKVVDVCVHYKPAVIYEKSIGTVRVKRGLFYVKQKQRENQPAHSLVKRFGTNSYCCAHCDVLLSEKQNERINKIVDYLNAGGDSDKKLSAMFKGIPVAETFAEGNKKWTQFVDASKEYVPAKNIIKPCS